jgi:hypothetical protein
MTKRRLWVWRLAAIACVTLLILVSAYPPALSPRMDALEPSLSRFAPLDDFRQVATQNDIPLELGSGESGEPPNLYTNFVVPLDGLMWGKKLHLKFRKCDTGYVLYYAVVVGGDGKEERWWRSRW